MGTIFEIERDLIAIFEELEENGGELTPEIEEKLQLNEEEVTRKVKSYVAYINKLKADEAAIKVEQDRLAALKKSKDNAIKSIAHLVLYAIKTFGNEDKKGKKFFDWGTGKVSIRNTSSVEVDTAKVDAVTEVLETTFENGIFTNTLQCNDSIDTDALLDAANNAGGKVEVEDLDDITVEVTVPISVSKLLNGDGYELMKQIGVTSPNVWKFKSVVDKKAIKNKIANEGCESNIAKVVTNENLTIK